MSWAANAFLKLSSRETVTEEQEHVVQRARDNMRDHDRRPALWRWLDNHGPDPKQSFSPHFCWCTVTRAGRDWRVDIGFVEQTRPQHTILVDGRAPAPPVMEWQPPRPEPVPHRFNVPPPIYVPEFRETLVSPEPDSLTCAKLEDMMRRVQQEYAVPRHLLPQEPAFRNTATEILERRREAELQLLRNLHYGMSRAAVIAIDIDGDGPKPAPPPAPTRRNQ